MSANNSRFVVCAVGTCFFKNILCKGCRVCNNNINNLLSIYKIVT
jgi:hypothetical protein